MAVKVSKLGRKSRYIKKNPNKNPKNKSVKNTTDKMWWEMNTLEGKAIRVSAGKNPKEGWK